MTYREFKDSVLYEIEKAEKGMNEDSVLDLRAFRYPYKVNIDNAIFCVDEIFKAWEFVKDAREWCVDIFENIYEDGKSIGAEYTGCSVEDNGDVLKLIDSCDLYAISWKNGVQYIKLLGYYYDAGCSVTENEEETWRYVQYIGYELPLAEFLAMSDLERNNFESEHTHYIEDLTREDVLDAFSVNDKPHALHWDEVTEDTPTDKTYIAI